MKYSLAIELGSVYTSIFKLGSGLVLKEPTLICAKYIDEEYKIIDALENERLDYSDLRLINRILNNQKVSEETRRKVADKLNKIIKTNWLED